MSVNVDGVVLVNDGDDGKRNRVCDGVWTGMGLLDGGGTRVSGGVGMNVAVWCIGGLRNSVRGRSVRLPVGSVCGCSGTGCKSWPTSSCDDIRNGDSVGLVNALIGAVVGPGELGTVGSMWSSGVGLLFEGFFNIIGCSFTG